ncbi:unnamed protein product [Symbiodinium sp. CCMP2456]|nr:unnamed protein product [Symbiodinium sp. CCMP2456]
MTDEEQLAATKASADEAIKIAAKSKGIAEGDTVFLMNLMKAIALEEVAVNVQTAFQVKAREMKHAKKYRTAKQAKMEIISKLAQKEIQKAEQKGHAKRIPDVVVQVEEGDAADDQKLDVDQLIEDELAGQKSEAYASPKSEASFLPPLLGG